MERLMSDGYPFIFQMIDKSESDEYLIQTLQYRFKSDKSHHAYIVRVECYKKHAYCVKFFDKANINSNNKFSLRSNTFEVRTILYTMFHIMLDVLKRDEKASFFFIGAEDEKDQDGMVSRRFRLYRRFVLSTVSDDKFEHFRRNDLSLYILVNKETEQIKRSRHNVVYNLRSIGKQYKFSISPTIAMTRDLWRKIMDEVSVSEVI